MTRYRTDDVALQLLLDLSHVKFPESHDFYSRLAGKYPLQKQDIIAFHNSLHVHELCDGSGQLTID